MTDTPKTLLEAVRFFTLHRCNEYMQSLKWPDGKIICPKCGNDSCKQLASRPVLKCNRASCQKQFSYKVGTIFEDSPLSLDKWFVAVWCVANSKNGISSHELGRALGVTQKTAWFMEHRIREAMKTGSFQKLAGPVESDETFIGGKAINMHAKKREGNAFKKVAVQGVIQRGGEVRTFVVCNTEAVTLQRNIYHHVVRGEVVYTDSATGYAGLARDFVHSTVDHVTQYVRGKVHTNSIENFWCLLKRSIKGTWTHIAPVHVGRYCDEQSWRMNHRKTHDGSRFNELMRGVIGRRITYRRLCAIGDAGFMGLK